jgi:hypothetical protein
MGQVLSSESNSTLKPHHHLKKNFWQQTNTQQPIPLRKVVATSTQLGQKRAPSNILQRLDSIVYQTYNTNTNSWVNSSKGVYTYNQQGADSVDVYLTYSNNTWINLSQDVYRYDSLGLDTLDLYSEWNANSGSWIPVSKDIYSYYPTGLDSLELSTDLYLKYDVTATSKWDTLSQEIFTYDSNGNDTLDLVQADDNHKWVDSVQYYYNVDINSTYLGSTYSTYDSINKVWVNVSQDVYAYDANGNFISDINSIWNTNWVNNAQNLYTYDSNFNETSEYNSQWQSGAWVNTQKDTLTVNNAYTYDQMWLPTFFYNEYPYYHELTNILSSTYQAGIWQNSNNTLFYYSPLNGAATGVIPVSNDNNVSFVVSPNPTPDVVKFDWTNDNANLTLAVYNIGGKLVLQQTIANNATVSMSNFSAGLYIYTLSANNKVLNTGKIVKVN